MARTPPRSGAAPDSALSRVPHPDPLSKSYVPWTVPIWEPRQSRLPLISRIISECGARPRYIDNVAAMSQVELSHRSTLAVVALGACPSPGDVTFEAIASLRRKGFRIICHEHGTQSWSLGQRCQILLAGASWLLDSAKASFAQELRGLLAQLLRAEDGRLGETESIKRTMRKLGNVGESQAIMAVFQTTCRVGKLSDLPVLITGESGTGKELLARAIHQLDPKRQRGPFVPLNCSAISPNLAESELFGHRRGAFTGADRDRRGLIRSAEGGVLFLDEIGELDDVLQSKLLRVLQEHRVLGVGEDSEVSVSVRIIAATNRDLQAMVRRGRFREDLFHRLNILPIYIPPLRERPEDLKPLTEHFLAKHHLLKPAWSPVIGGDFIDAVTQLDLPGNARQLENLVRWVLVNKDDDGPLNLSDLPLDVWQQLSEQGKLPSVQSTVGNGGTNVQSSALEALQQEMPSYFADLLAINGWNLSQFLHFCEKLLLEAMLLKAGGNQSQAARLLGITPRSVYNKLQKHRLHR
jgi:transcriptional regulator with GAF, ATPase, and Fis domain